MVAGARTVYLYFEGDSSLRQAVALFFQEIADICRGQRVHLRFVAGEGQTLRKYFSACATYGDGAVFALLDSEGPDDGQLAESRKARRDWPGNEPLGKHRDRIFWMVQVMESWYLADVSALEGFYGQLFRRNRLPPNPNIEEIPKRDVLDSLHEATRETRKGAYHKTRHGPAILRSLDVRRVREASANCDRVFTTLEQHLAL